MEPTSRPLKRPQPSDVQHPAELQEEQTGPTCVPPQPITEHQVSEEEVCRLCRRADCEPEVVGELCHQDGLSVHENCLYHARRLIQRGADEEGFYGFLFPDILQELERVAKKRCCICRLWGASVTCQARRCYRNFHLPCGSERGCIFQYFGEYKSFCWKHRSGGMNGTPPLLVLMAALSQGQALCSALHYFRCPLCRDMDTFRKEMFRLGIKIPDRPWRLLLCSSCGASGTHQHCSNLRESSWECNDCSSTGTVPTSAADTGCSPMA
ncbi:PHD finger protein 7 [Antrostomus carolinensis]|uniref:PHD finger protein 7 n=1 Tax=Antrostomus carolinensis TaxID=279965 RepID=UPI000528C68D|nr:PHD finger protein 7 [Antrostomus carolinensis]